MIRTLPDPTDTTPAILRQAYVLVKIAAARSQAGDTTLRYFIRLAGSHGLEVAKIAEAANLSTERVMEIMEPFEGSFA